MHCTTCNDSDYITAPATNSWRIYFNKTGCSHYHVKVPCPACGGVTGRMNREAMKKRLAERKAAGDIPLHF